MELLLLLLFLSSPLCCFERDDREIVSNIIFFPLSYSLPRIERKRNELKPNDENPNIVVCLYNVCIEFN